jgi:uncharacterized membrane protein
MGAMAASTSEAEATRVDRAGWIAGAALAAVLTLVGWIRHRNGWSGALDLGIFDQGVWLLSRGLAPEVTINGRNLFADHLSPVLVLFAPLYRLVASPMWLVAAQAASIGIGVPAIRRFAANRGVDRTAPTVAWVLAAPLLAAAVFDAHPSTMAVGPLAWLLVALDGPNRRPVLLAAAAVLFCRADLGWIVASTAIVAPARFRRDLVVVGLFGVALGWLVPGTLGTEATFPVHYGQLGESPFDALTHPWRVLTALNAADLRTYALWLMAGGFLTVGAPRWAITVAVAGLPVLLSDWPGTESPWFHYGAPMVPLVLAGAIVTLSSGATWARPRYLVAGAAAAALLASPLSPKASGASSLYEIASPRVGSELDRALAAVDGDEPVAAVNRVLAHLAHREQAYGWPIPFRDTSLSILYGGENRDAADAIHVVIAEDADRDELEALGFEVEDIGHLVIGRR